MSILVQCPECGAKLSAPPHAAGKKIRCRKCEAIVRIPEEESAADLPALPGRDDRDDSPRRSPSRRRRDDEEDHNRSHSKKASGKTPWVPILLGCGLLGLVGFGVAALLLSGGKKKNDDELVFKDGKFFPPKEIPADHPLNKPYVPPPPVQAPPLKVNFIPVELTPHGLRASIKVPSKSVLKWDHYDDKIEINYEKEFSVEISKQTKTKEQIKAERAGDLKDNTWKLIIDEPNTLVYQSIAFDYNNIYHWTTVSGQPYQLTSGNFFLHTPTANLVLESIRSFKEEERHKKEAQQEIAAREAFVKAGGEFEDMSPYKVLINEKTKLDIAMPALKQMIVYQISVDNAPVTPQQLQPLFVNYSIKSLKLTGSTITDEVFAAFCRMPLLEQVSLSNTAITDQGIKAFSKLRELTELSLHRDDTKVTPQGLTFLKAMPSLKSLRLDGLDLPDTTLAFLSPLKKLTHLNLSYCKVADAGLVFLKELPDLKYLNLSGAKISDAGVLHLDLPQLVSLSLASTPITNKALASLSSLKSLKSLSLNSTAITNEGLANLKALSALTSLSLSYTKITEQGLSHLYGMTQLAELDVGSIPVSKMEIDEFQKQMPNVSISYTKR
jgi:hypothetical protein